LRIDTDNHSYTVAAGRAARLASDRLYSYHADSEDPTNFVRVVHVTQPEN
jgi:hypothetical protein